MLEIVNRNSFRISKTVLNGAISGQALFYVPSFFNHSCMPNTFYYTHGDMIFFTSSTMISAGTELLWSYINSTHADTHKDRATPDRG